MKLICNLKQKLGCNLQRVLIGIGVIASLYCIYLYAPIIKIGKDVRYSYADVYRFYSMDQQMSEILGVPGMKSYSEAFANLGLAGMEKSLLAAKDVRVVRDEAISLITKRSFAKGTLKKLQSKYGTDDYYRLVVEPIIIAEVFNDGYYRIYDPNRKVAEDTLKIAQANGMLQAASHAGVKITQLAIPYAITNQVFVDESRRGVGAVYGRVIEGPGFYCVCTIREVKNDGVLVDGVVIPRKPIYDFVVDELKSNSIPVSYGLISVFKAGTIKGVFAPEQKNDTKNQQNPGKK